MGIIDYIASLLRSSEKEKSRTPEGRQERYREWQQQLQEKQVEQKRLQRQIEDMQRRLQRDPSNTSLNSRVRQAGNKQARLAREASKLKTNIYIHKP